MPGGGFESCMCKHHGGEFTSSGAKSHYAPNLALEPVHLDIKLRFNYQDAAHSKTVFLEVTNRIRANAIGSRTISLDAVGFSDVVARDANGGESEFRYDGQKIHFTWKKEFTKGEERELITTYSVTSPVTGLMLWSPDPAYPKRALFAATDHETERARYWLACVDFPVVRTSISWRCTAPKEMTFIANGALQREEIENDLKTSYWKCDHRVPSYLLCFGLGRFVSVSEPVDSVEGGVPISYYGCAEICSEENLRITFGPTPKIMNWMVKKFRTPFPFSNYKQLIVPHIGGAMENITLTTFDDVFLLDSAYSKEYQLVVDEVNVHEMSHSYFGDSLVIRHFEHAWLKESWATYVEALWQEDHFGRAQFRYQLFANQTSYFNECEGSYIRPIVTREYNASWDLFDRHLYPGGSWRLHMLRERLGDENFFVRIQMTKDDVIMTKFHEAAVASYLQTHAGGVVETVDFQRALEKHSALNLNKFFDQWLYGKGYPKIKATFQYNAETHQAKVNLEQTQADSKKGISFFDLDNFEVFLCEENGTKQTLSGRFDESGRCAIHFRVSSAVRRVEIDPQQKHLFALEFNPGEDILLNNFAAHSDEFVRSRIFSAQELIQIGSRSALSKLLPLVRSEPLWGVRLQVVAALRKSQTRLAIDALCSCVLAEKDPVVHYWLISYCDLCDEQLRAALLQLLSRTGQDALLYKARARALECLGAQRNADDLKVLLEALNDLSWNGFVRSGAFAGLGNMRSAESYVALRDRMRYGAEAIEKSRPFAVAAFAKSASFQSSLLRSEAIDILTDLLRDWDDRVQWAAINGLVLLQAKQSSAAISATRPTMSAANGVRLDRTLKKLAGSGDEETVVKLKKMLEDLENRVVAVEKSAPPPPPQH